MSKKSKPQTVTQKTELPPQYTQALDFILGQSQGLANQYLPQTQRPVFNGFGRPGFGGFGGGFNFNTSTGGTSSPLPPIVPELSDQTMQGIDRLGQAPNPLGRSELEATVRGKDIASFVPQSALNSLNSTAGGDFLAGGEGFNAALDAAMRRITPQVLSTFGASGRSDSGLAQQALAQAGFDAFAGQFANERANQLNATNALATLGAQERGRQLGAISPLTGLGQMHSQNLLNAGNILEQQDERVLREPFERLNLSLDPIIRAVGGAPRTTTTTQPTSRNIGAGLLGGAATGIGIGQGIGSLAGLGSLTPLGAGVFGLGGALLGGLI